MNIIIYLHLHANIALQSSDPQSFHLESDFRKLNSVQAHSIAGCQWVGAINTAVRLAQVLRFMMSSFPDHYHSNITHNITPDVQSARMRILNHHIIINNVMIISIGKSGNVGW